MLPAIKNGLLLFKIVTSSFFYVIIKAVLEPLTTSKENLKLLMQYKTKRLK